LEYWTVPASKEYNGICITSGQGAGRSLMDPVILEILDKHDYLLANYIGEYDQEAGKRMVDRIIQGCTEYHLSKVVLDCTSMAGGISIIDRYLVVVYGQKLLGLVTNLALVGRPEAVLPNKFEEIVARNRGINLHVFDNLEDAIAFMKA
jgi:hypothetical protein